MKVSFITCLLAVALMTTGCQDNADSAAGGEGGGSSSEYLAATEPQDAIPVGEARQSTEDGQEVTLVGLIGGSSEPFVNGLAAFTIVDAKVPFCAPEEGCPTPWDYCCETEAVKDNIATVKIVDSAGKPVTQDARELLDVKELATVVVCGTAKRDDVGNLTVAANQVYVRRSE